MISFIKSGAIVGVAGLCLAAAPAMAADNDKVAAAVMAMARAQWAAEIANKPVLEQIATLSDDYTEFNPTVPIRIDGKALNARFYEAGSSDGSASLAAEMINPRVQVYGDAAILTYNFVGISRDKDGKVAPNNAVSTRVYANIGGKWQLVHGHFSAVK